jgi:hypothetical protein
MKTKYSKDKDAYSGRRWEGQLHIIKDYKPNVNREEAQNKERFVLGSVWENRKGTYEVKWTGKAGVKIKYSSINKEYLNDVPDANSKIKEFWQDDFTTAYRIHTNIISERKGDNKDQANNRRG